MALASSGPTQSIAVGIVGLMAAVYYHTFLPILICFIPMIGIAIGYQRLNAWQPSAGATYSWVGRALNPHAGFFAGWIMLMYYTIGTTSLTVPLGTYFLSFFSEHAPPTTSTGWPFVGSRLRHPRAHRGGPRHQAVGALQLGLGDLRVRAHDRLRHRRPSIMIYGTGLSGSVHTVSSLFTLPKTGLITGLLIAIFLYSGWDTAAYVGEEAKGKQAGRPRS